MNPVVRSIDGVCEVELLRGAAADAARPPAVVLDVPHGATRGEHFRALRERLAGDLPDDLIEFFFVNTDVGAPELARAIAERFVTAVPSASALVLRSLLPRTLVDCNRSLDPASLPRRSAAGELTPGLPPWIREGADQRLLLELHAAYRGVAEAAFAAVCGQGPDGGGLGLMVHTYAPRSIDVPVDDHIVEHLRSAYERIEAWPLRSEIDLITADPDGRALAHPRLAAAVAERLARRGRAVVENGTYALHPSTVAHELATRWPQRTLCFEVRRDLLVGDFVPFVELAVDPGRAADLAEPFAAALAAELPAARA